MGYRFIVVSKKSFFQLFYFKEKETA